MPLDAGNVTADEVIGKCADALGGAAKIKGIKTVRFKVTYPGHEHMITTEIMRPNRIRNSADYILTFDGKRAGYLKTEPGHKGPKVIPPEHLKDFELEIALFFPAFFDHKATYKGVEKVDGVTLHKLYLELPLGAILTYYIDAETFLPYKAVSRIEFQGKTYYPVRIYKDYKRVDGILYPHSFLYAWRKGEEKKKAQIHKVEFNVPLAKNYFEPPAEVKD
jgi:hypothetical protein